MNIAASKDTGNIPVIHTDFRIDRPAFWHYRELGKDRDANPFYWNDSTKHGFWMFTRYEHVYEALHMPEVFSNREVNAFVKNASLPLLPQNLDGDAHRRLRAVLNPFFTPQFVQRIRDFSRERAGKLIDQLEPHKSIDFVKGFAMLYPTEVFLAMVGLPPEDGIVLLDWVEGVFDGFFGSDEAALKASEEGAAKITEYFEQAVNERRKNPRDPKLDLISRLIESRFDGKPLTQQEIITTCLTVLLAGLDTTRSGLGYIFHHLATRPEDRKWLMENQDQLPMAIEEFMRLYSLIIQDGRQATRDIDFHGCPIKEGDMVWLGVASSNRDPRKFENPDQFIMNRPNIREHIGFGTGQHQCLGKHLARAELAIALEEWHKRIPDYQLVEQDKITERGGQLRLQYLHLVWE